MLNKSNLTNIIALFLVGAALLIDDARISQPLLYTGLFAFSGAITNALAIHMLFEKVPLLYGSGVITNRFEAIKSALHVMMMEQFFTRAQIEDFFAAEERKIDLEPLIEQTDFSPAFDALSKTVMESSFGGMLGMFGGEKALEGLREPFSEKLKNAVIGIVRSDAFNAQLHATLSSSSFGDDLQERISQLIAQRLDTLTPQMVKELVAQLIKEHLGWLVVWGGVFGGLIGLLSALIML